MRVPSFFLFFSFILVLHAAIADTSPFLKTPYLVYAGSIPEMNILWQLTDSAQCTIEWGTDTTRSTGTELTTEYGTDHQHVFTICDLIPSTEYYYQVSCAGVSYAGSFYSAPDSTETSLSFMVYGDTRSNFMVHDSIAGAMVSIYRTRPEFQTILFGAGDMVKYGGYEVSWQKEFFNEEQTNLRRRMMDVPYVQCPGNHELYEKLYLGLNLDTPLLGKYFPYPYVDRRYWSLDYGPAHFTIVDQYPADYNGRGLISPEELAWIQDDLSTSSSDWKFVILHEPGWSCGSHSNNDDVQKLLQPIFEACGVQIVFSGHNHYYARACRNGVYHVTTGGGGAPLSEPLTDWPNVIVTRPDYNFCLLEIDRDTLSFRVLNLNKCVMDSFTVVKGSPPSYLLGSVTSDKGEIPLDNVLILVNGISVRTDAAGYYGIQLPPGVYDVSTSLDGYESGIFENISVTSGTETTLDIDMNPI